ncbi:MAG: tandem-95 repeat protein [Candidatus Cloacimonetes bacterium]|nr:tandem-95 repeat protein [Candidatus Cloacimonadota bacterium]
MFKCRKFILYITLLLVSLLGADPPDWNVIAPAYEFNANVIAAVQVNYVPENGAGNVLGAFFGDECRGVATPIMVNGNAVFFMTVYANQSGEVLSFRYYQAENDLILDIDETIIFQSNEVYGAVLDPLLLHAFQGFDNPPLLADIPDQTIDFGADFAPIDLNEYLTELDDDTILWSYTGAEFLQIVINSGVAAISALDENWSGSETITFTATDQTENGYFDSDSAIFTIRAEDHPPEVADILDQAIANGQQFTTISLDDYLTELDNDPYIWDFVFGENETPEQIPEWSVDAGAFEFTMTLTAQVSSENLAVPGNTHILAAFSGEECRGVANGISAMGEWFYFLTIYANINDEEITFRFYDAEKQESLPVYESVIFTANGAIGNPLIPFLLNAGNLLININENNNASFIIVDEGWTGSETVIFTVSDLGTTAGYSASDDVILSISTDHAPQILPITDQTITTGESFETIALNEHLIELDNDPVIWSFSLPVNLNLVMDEFNVITITLIDEDWLGSETVTFTVTDDTEFAAFSSQQVTFTVLGIDHEPVVDDIPDQTIATGMSFEDIDLNAYLTEIDGNDINWSYFFLPESSPACAPDWNVIPGNYEYTMSVTAEVVSEGYLAEGGTHLLAAFAGDECRGVTEAIFAVNRWLYFLTVYGNVNNTEISFRFFDAEMGRTIPARETINFLNNGSTGSPLAPLVINAGDLMIDIEDGIARIGITDDAWAGEAVVRFQAQDQGTPASYSDFDEVLFTIIDDHAPQINPIPDQVIFIGEEFEAVALNDYLVELDNDPVIWSCTGAQNLAVSLDENAVAVISVLSEDWTGTDIITFRVEDETDFSAWDTQDVSFTVLPEDHPPLVIDIPDQSVYSCDGFQQIDLSQYLIELDDNPVVWSYEFQVNEQPEPVPEWNVNPAAYQYSMTLTAEVLSKGYTASGDAHLLAAFTGDECRGLTSAMYVLDRWLYFLTIYSNYNDENISLRFYDAYFQQALPVSQEFMFNSNQALGNPLNPVMLSAGFLTVDIDQQSVAGIEINDFYWSGSEVISFIATDQETMYQYSSFDEVMFTVMPRSQLLLPESFAFNEDEMIALDLSQYLVNGNPTDLALSVHGNQQINVEITGYNVDISAPANWFGSELLFFTITSQQNRYSYTDSTVITVIPVNDPPVIIQNLPDLERNEDFEMFYIMLEQYFSDIDEDQLYYSAEFNTQEIDLIIEDNILLVYSADNWNGITEITVTADDNFSRLYVTDTFSISILPVNDPPVITLPDSFSFNEDASLEVNFADYILDVDNEELTLTWMGNQNISIFAEQLDLTFSTPANWFGIEQIVFLVDDGQSRDIASDTLLIEVLSVNDPPVADAGSTYIGYTYSSDPVLITLDGSASFDVDGEIISYSWNWDTGYGSGMIHSAEFPIGETLVILTVTDNENSSASDTTLVVIYQLTNLPPQAVTDVFQIEEDTQLTGNILTNDNDPDTYPDILAAALQSDVSFGLLNLQSDGSFTYLPAENWFGEDGFTYQAYDGMDYSETVSVSITVIPVNDPPTIDPPAEVTFLEDGSYTLDFAEYVSDIDGDELLLTVSGNESIYVLIEDLLVTFSAPINWNGSELITFSVNDNSSRVFASADISVHIIPVNDPPIVNLPSAFFFYETETLTVDITPYVSDPENAPLSLHIFGYNHLNVEIEGLVVTFSATDNWTGTEFLTFMVIDSQLRAYTTALVAVHVMPGGKPQITAIYDVPDDQGGWVSLEFNRSLYDNIPSQESYLVQRNDERIWNSLAVISATGAASYQVILPTISDSCSASNIPTEFRIIAEMDEGTWISDPAVGFSLDNIAPTAPAGLSLNDDLLSWDTSTAPDFAFYSLYQNDVWLADTVENSYSLAGLTGAVNLTSTDIHDNESTHSENIQVFFYAYGDVDYSGEVDAFDAALILKFAVGLDPQPYAPLPWDEWRIRVADLDGNLSVDAYDSALVLQFLVGMIDYFPIEGLRIEYELPHVNISWQEEHLQFEVTGDCFAFSILELGSASIWGQPVVLCEDILTAYNETEQRFAVASPYPIEGCFLKIPLKHSFQKPPAQITISFQLNDQQQSRTIYLIQEENSAPQVTALKPNFPNPFNPETAICFQVAQDQSAVLSIYNLCGQMIYTNTYPAGEHKFIWKADKFASGIYFYSLQAPDYSQIRKMTLIK